MTLPDDVRAYIADGAATGETNAENRRALDRWRLMPRVLVDVSSVTMTTPILGVESTAPFLIAPMAAQRLVHPDGELAVARAAARVGVPMVLSTSSTVPVEAVGAVAGLDLWFQLYPFADAVANRQVVERAVAAGARAVVLTVDMPPPGRFPSLGSAVQLPSGVEYAHHPRDPEMSTHFLWSDLEDLVAWAGVPVVVKGAAHPRDVERAGECGAAGVVISNHGGRVQDGMVGAVDALATLNANANPSGVDSSADGAPALFLDGAIQTGADIVRAVALGATAALVGRSVLWALSAGGEAAVVGVLEQFLGSVERAMATIGAATVDAITRDHVRHIPS